MIRRRDEPADYCFIGSEPGSRLTPLERLTLTGGKELEKAVAWMAKQFGSIAGDKLLAEISLPAIERVLADYGQAPWSSNPESFFVKPTGLPAVEVTPVHGFPDGIVEDLRFQSRFEPHHPDVRAVRARHPENEIVHARIWRHHEVPPATIVAIHGWTMGDQRINSLAFLPGVFYQLGLDVVLIELPYHGRRRPQDILSMDPLLTTDGIAQGIGDLRDIARYLRSIGRTEIGVMGMSLGGYLSSLWASLDPLAFCIPIVPLVSLAELEWEIVSRQKNFSELQAAGLTVDHFRRLYQVHCPLSHTPKIDRERMLLIAGLGDSVVPARQPKMLWDHWGRPRIHWFSGGHVVQFKRSKAFTEVIHFLREQGFIEVSRIAP